MRIAFVLIPVLLLGLFGCADRDRTNPLDPKNSDTMGKPSGLSVTSRSDTVRLFWDRISLKDLIGFQVYRKTGDDQNFTRLDVAPGFEFVDTSVEFGVSYFYKISALGYDFESATSDSVCIEPGPTYNWALGSPDNVNLALYKFTHDFKHQIHATFGFLRPKDLEVDYHNGQAWVLDEINFVRGQLIRVTSNGDIVEPLINLTAPSDIEIERSTGMIWVSDGGDSTIKKYSRAGLELFSVGGFQEPVALAIDQSNGDCWVADVGKAQVIKVRSDGQELSVSHENFQALVWLAFDSDDSAVWVAEADRLTKLAEDGTQLFSVSQTFDDIQKIAVNQKNGDLWMISRHPDLVYKISRDGTIEFSIDGFEKLVDLSISEFENSCVVSDIDKDQIIRISAKGESAPIVQKLFFPIAIAVQNTF